MAGHRRRHPRHHKTLTLQAALPALHLLHLSVLCCRSTFVGAPPMAGFVAGTRWPPAGTAAALRPKSGTAVPRIAPGGPSARIVLALALLQRRAAAVAHALARCPATPGCCSAPLRPPQRQPSNSQPALTAPQARAAGGGVAGGERRPAPPRPDARTSILHAAPLARAGRRPAGPEAAAAGLCCAAGPAAPQRGAAGAGAAAAAAAAGRHAQASGEGGWVRWAPLARPARLLLATAGTRTQTYIFAP